MNKKNLTVIMIFAILIAVIYLAMNGPRSGGTHDVAVSGITVSPTQAQRGTLVEITVNVTNKGSTSESFNVSLTLNSAPLQTLPILNLDSGAERSLAFHWNTTEAASANYLIKAEAGPVAEETNTTDNTLTHIAYVRTKPTGQARAYVSPQNSSTTVGQDFAVNISVSNATDLYGWEFKLSWNNTILHLLNVTEGSFLKSVGATFFTHNLNATDQHIIVDCTRLVDLPEVSGNGVLATVTFHVEQPGSCDLNLYDTALLNSFEQSINHTTENGHFTEET